MTDIEQAKEIADEYGVSWHMVLLMWDLAGNDWAEVRAGYAKAAEVYG